MNVVVQILQSTIVWISLFTWFLCQCIKFIIKAANTKQYNFALFYKPSGGGMPSSHAAVISAFTTLLYLDQGVTPVFLTAGMLAGIVVFDAITFRRQLGIQAKLINTLRKKGPKIEENLGHEPTEVLAGVIIGIALAVLLY